MPLTAVDLPSLGSAPTASEHHRQAHSAKRSSAEPSTRGEPIRQDDVAKLFDVSKIPVREALKRLEAEGLVEFHRNRGAVVASVSEPEIAQIFEVRAMLESSALKLSVPRMTAKTFQRAEEYCDVCAGDECRAMGRTQLAVSFMSLRGCGPIVSHESHSIRQRSDRALSANTAHTLWRNRRRR